MKKLRDNGRCVAIASGEYSEDVLRYWSSFEPDMLSAGADFDFIRDGAQNKGINMERIHKEHR